MRERRRPRRGADHDPFGALGLPREAGLPDDEVRAAWRRIAAATHPDRDDGGDPARFGAAAAAYADLRTAYGRGEILADLASGHDDGQRRRAGRGRRGGGTDWGVWSGRGRVGVLVLRVIAAVGVSAAAFAVAGWSPAWIGVLAGVLTWLVVTGWHDLPSRARDWLPGGSHPAHPPLTPPRPVIRIPKLGVTADFGHFSYPALPVLSRYIRVRNA